MYRIGCIKTLRMNLNGGIFTYQGCIYGLSIGSCCSPTKIARYISKTVAVRTLGAFIYPLHKLHDTTPIISS